MRPVDSVLELETFQEQLETKVIGRASGVNELWETIDSTNSRAAELAAAGAPEGTIVMARQQTAGRGRLGRSWLSPLDSGLYLSVILRPQALASNELSLLTLACGVATAQAVERVAGLSPGLKWVNDLIYEGRKIGGILAEFPSIPVTAGMAKALIVGIGINLRLESKDIPEELQNIVGSLEQFCKQPINASSLAAALVLELERVYDLLKRAECTEILNAWRKRSITLAREILVVSGSKRFKGFAQDIAQNGALVVRTEDGGITELFAGEVSIRAQDEGYI